MFKISSTVFKLFCSSDVKCFHLTSRYRSLTSLNLFTREHDEMRKTVNKIIEKDINPFVDEWEKAHKYPAKQVFQKLGNAGLLGITKPTQYGGLGLDYSFTVAFLEELSNINCSGVPMSIAVQTDMAIPALARFGSEELKQEFLAPTIAGDKVACIGVSEVHCGSDVASISTKAVRKGDDLIINGGKMWITNGTQADWMCMLANTRDGPPHKNKSLICVPLNLPVPPRLSQIIQATVDYCKERKAFGQPIINNQVIHYTLAELQSEVEALRSLIYRAAAMMIDGQDVTLLASMAKLKAGRLAREVTDKCLQFWGGMGYTSDVNISRAFRDARLISIAGGSDEIMLSIISKFMGTFPKTK
ncbi:probable acyl-CoA dehydrogenase 6 isoform X2 [Stegodyphus dumicola]|uniref:probable acyl-CoA dehydrogenase 6 isoform X2 n=1 Tax=Stegodyphus dumicola TaxID=202533 RepID=UPI0015AB0991|nr:probable acyl-CoA dehydrogenase 6 isoform X2 [Stegodyphus dumicola]